MARRSFWCINRTLEAAGFHVRALPRARPVVRRVGLRPRGAAALRRRRSDVLPGLRYLDAPTLAALFVLGPGHGAGRGRGQPPQQPGPGPLLRGGVAALELKTRARLGAVTAASGDGRPRPWPHALPRGPFGRASRARSSGEPSPRPPRCAAASTARARRDGGAWGSRFSAAGDRRALGGLGASSAPASRDFVLLELEDAPGGTARSGSGPVTPYPWGAHYVPVPTAANRPWWRCSTRWGRSPGATPRASRCGPRRCSAATRRSASSTAAQWHEGLYPRDGASPEDLAPAGRASRRDMRRWARWRDARGPARLRDSPRARLGRRRGPAPSTGNRWPSTWTSTAGARRACAGSWSTAAATTSARPSRRPRPGPASTTSRLASSTIARTSRPSS